LEANGWLPTSFSALIVNNPQALRVLVVDDERLIRWSLAEALTECGHIVTEAVDAASARRIVADAAPPPDVVLLDYRLPDSDDLGLLATIRHEAPDARVILMTAYGSPEVVKGAMELGAYRVVSKPFEVDDLAALVLEAHTTAR
jgi:DNA-binding NtrC family response regulator